MRLKFQDVECYRDYQYDYSEIDDQAAEKEFDVWKPMSLDEIKKEEEKPKPEKEKSSEIDEETAMYAAELGLRSLKHQSSSTDVEQLDLSSLDYDVIDVLDGDTNIKLNFRETKRKNETSVLKPNALNDTLFPNWKELDGLNLTAVNLLAQSISENITHMQNSSMPSTFENKMLNKTVCSPNMLPKNDSLTRSSSASANVSNCDNLAVSDTNNTTVHNVTSLPVVRNVSAGITNFTVTVQETTNRPQILVDSEERLTRGDVFFYSVPPPTSSTNNLNSAQGGNVTSLSHILKKEYENTTATKQVNLTADGLNHSLSIEMAGEGDISSTGRYNMTILESMRNKTNGNDSRITTAEPEYGQENSSEIFTIPVNSSLENVTDILLKTRPLQNVTVNSSISDSPEEIISHSRENVTALRGELNHTAVESFYNETSINLSLTRDVVRKSSSVEQSASDSSEEMFIYLKENSTNLIKTTSVKTQGQNWTYDGTHQMVPKDIPDDMKKYFGRETPKATPTPKKIRKVNIRQWPQKGQGMKTRKKKEFKPQARSGLPFSPRGFNPGMTPRGSRPHVPKAVSDEEELINIPVVIGVPRPDFSDYELYVPGDEPDHLGLDGHDVKADEYEYVMYKDPYSSHEDIKNLNLDDTTKYYLKIFGTNVKTYFIAAEEVEWDYAGYGQR